MKSAHQQGKPKKFGMVIDLDKCTGCASCMVACMSENNIPFRADETDKMLGVAWMRVFKLNNGKEFPEHDICYLPRPCQHCEGQHEGHSPCVSVCPATATDYEMDSGIVSQIYTRCFGCRYCMGACPYHVRVFNWWDPIWPDGMEQALNPKVSVRMRGVVEKCSFCYHRFQMAKDKAFVNGEREVPEAAYQTACTQACPASAITFGDLNNPGHQVHDLKGKSNTFRLLERLGTNTKVYYHSKRKWVQRALDNYLTHEETGHPTHTRGGGH